MRQTNYEDFGDFGGRETPAQRKKRLSEEMGIEAGAAPVPAPVPETQEQRYARELEEARTGAANQLAQQQSASQAALSDMERKQAESREAMEASRKSVQTQRDNMQTDLTHSGDPLLISGGSAQQAVGDEQEVKKKIKGGGISAQVGINV